MAMAVALPSNVVAGDPPDPPIIDTHQHLWDLNRFWLPWLDGAGDTLKRSHTPRDYLNAADGLNVVKAIYIEVAVDPKQRADEADYVIDLCRRKAGPTVAAVIAGAPDSPDFDTYISRFKDSPFVKGVRSSFDAGLASDQFVANLRRLGQLGMCYDINTGPAGLERAAAIVTQCPDTRFVLDHCGNIDATSFRERSRNRETRASWLQGISMVAERKNVVCKISGVMEASRGNATADDYAAVIDHCLDSFGPDRVMFASNWPVVNRGGSFARWVQVVRHATKGRSEIDRRKLFHDNALHFYRLA